MRATVEYACEHPGRGLPVAQATAAGPWTQLRMLHARVQAICAIRRLPDSGPAHRQAQGRVSAACRQSKAIISGGPGQTPASISDARRRVGSLWQVRPDAGLERHQAREADYYSLRLGQPQRLGVRAL